MIYLPIAPTMAVQSLGLGFPSRKLLVSLSTHSPILDDDIRDDGIEKIQIPEDD